MKVGNLTLYRPCFNLKIWMPKNPWGGCVLQFILLAGNLGLFIFSAIIAKDLWNKVLVFGLTAITTLLFLRLSTSDPGIPP